MIEIKEVLSEKELNDFFDHNTDDLHVVKFGAEWCGPCKSLEARLKNLDSEKIGNTLFAEVDISENDECETIAEKYGVSSIPCMIYFKNKEIADRTVGLVSLDDIYNRINKLNE